MFQLMRGLLVVTLIAGGILVFGLVTPQANGQEKSGLLPESDGLAAKYPDDVGIERDSSVLFAENFETGDLQDLGNRWSEVSNRGGRVLAYSNDAPPVSSGKRSLQMTGTLGENSGGHLYTLFTPGVDKAFVRFYTKFAPDHGYEHHFVELGGYHPATPWPHPSAGSRPAGDDRVLVFIDPIGWYGRYPPPGIWGLYTYWPEMKVSADGMYWGNVLSPAQPAPVSRGRWLSVELMVQLNSSPEKSDGELALWIDGRLVMHFAKGMQRSPWSGMGFNLVETGGEPFEGLRLRTSMDLKINHLWLEHYVDEGAQRQNRVQHPNRINRVWFDDIVVSTVYVGPIPK